MHEFGMLLCFEDAVGRDENGLDWIRTEASFGWIKTGSDCNFFENWSIRAGSD